MHRFPRLFVRTPLLALFFLAACSDDTSMEVDAFVADAPADGSFDSASDAQPSLDATPGEDGGTRPDAGGPPGDGGADAATDAVGGDTGVRCEENQRVVAGSCAVCPPGTTNAAGDDPSGPNTTCDATLCAMNQRVGANTCVDCAPGLGNAPGDDASGPNTTCDAILCAENHHVVAHMCVPCPMGMTRPAGDDASGLNTSCLAERCTEDRHVVSNACVDCPPGTTNAPGDDSSGLDTSCDAVVCPANQNVDNNECVDCPPGTTNAAGDDASGVNTTCDPTLCPADERVISNACAPCPPGMNNAAGDDSSGVDTTCDVIFCAADERVVDNTCTPCLIGESNAAGDDATGADTLCEDACFTSLGVTCDVFVSGYIKASNTNDRDYFGTVALSGNTLVVGAVGESSDANGVGGAQSDNSAPDAGAVYVYVRNGAGVWAQQAYLKASNSDAGDQFGVSVAIDGDYLVVGANGEDSLDGTQGDNLGGDTGAAYVFLRSGTTWAQQAYLKASNISRGDDFGRSVDIDGSTIVVGAASESSDSTGVGGAQNEDARDSGAVYVFTRSGSTWNEQAFIKASNTGRGDRFGYSVAISGNTLVAGAPGEDSVGTGINGPLQSNNDGFNPGAAYIFFRSGTTWTQQAYVKPPNPGDLDDFGGDVAVGGNTVVIGAISEDSDSTGINGALNDSALGSGAVYVFSRSGTTWSQQAFIKASNAERTDGFGSSFAVSSDGTTLAVGAFGESSNAVGVGGDQGNNITRSSGAVYLFRRSGSTWAQQAYIKSSNPGSNDRFGGSGGHVALSGGLLAVGAQFERSQATGVGGDESDDSLFGAGAVYVRVIDP